MPRRRRAGRRGGGPRAAAACAAAAAAASPPACEALATSDSLGAKVWLDRYVFNDTLQAVAAEPGGVQVFRMSEARARERGLGWPVSWPTLCFLGLGPSSVDLLVMLALLFPELQLALLDARDPRVLAELEAKLGEAAGRVGLGRVEDFAEARGPERRSCQAVAWSVDTVPFSFYMYRELFYSSPYILAIYSFQGCTAEAHARGVDGYHCEYLLQAFQATLCGRITESHTADYGGEDFYIPMVGAGCSETLCMCHAHSDAFIDLHFEHLCRKGEDHRFMGQWGQDMFLHHNVFHRGDRLRNRGLYVDVGASYPHHMSNTAYFDQCWGWRGICIEANPRMAPLLRGLRSCEVITACAWANETTMRFTQGSELAAITDDDTLLPSPPLQMPGGDARGTYFEARCAPLESLIEEGLPGALAGAPAAVSGPLVVDLLSVDAEGAEVEIFRNFPFDRLQVRAIVVETSRRTSMAVDGLLLPMGFLKVAVLGKDAVYVHHRWISEMPSGGPLLPARIQWSEPGSDADSTDYLRFQRLFGVDGDLDEEVGDGRLQNETELALVQERQEAKNRLRSEEVRRLAEAAIVGGSVSRGSVRAAVDSPEVQALLQDAMVRDALLALHGEPDSFERRLAADAALAAKIGKLVAAGVVSHPAATRAAAVASCPAGGPCEGPPAPAA